MNAQDDSQPDRSELRRPGFIILRTDGKLDAAVSTKPLTTEQVDELRAVTRVVFDLQPTSIAYEVVAANARHFFVHGERHQKVMSSVFQSSRDPVGDGLEGFVEATRLVMNFLASCSAFIDQGRRSIQVQLGPQSEVLEEWDKIRTRLYDTRFSYRFLYHLRNYVQHLALPIHSLDVDSRRIGGSGPWDATVTINLSREKLLATHDWKHAEEDLRSQDAKFDVTPLIREHLSSIGVLCSVLLAPHLGRVRVCGQYLQAFLRAFPVPSGGYSVVFVGEPAVPGQPPGRYEQVPVPQFLKLQSLADELDRLPRP